MKIKKLKINKEAIENACIYTIGIMLPVGVIAALAILAVNESDNSNNNNKSGCEIEKVHAHKYVTDDSFMCYRNSEDLEIDNVEWTDEVTELTSEINAMTAFNLFKICDNEEQLIEDTKGDLSYVEYEYEYHYTTYMNVGVFHMLMPISHTSTEYSKDENVSNKTGMVRDVNYKYFGYRFGVDIDGNLYLEKSELVDNLDEIKDEYPYFIPNDYKELVYNEPKEIGKVKTK